MSPMPGFVLSALQILTHIAMSLTANRAPPGRYCYSPIVRWRNVGAERLSCPRLHIYRMEVLGFMPRSVWSWACIHIHNAPWSRQVPFLVLTPRTTSLSLGCLTWLGLSPPLPSLLPLLSLGRKERIKGGRERRPPPIPSFPPSFLS